MFGNYKKKYVNTFCRIFADIGILKQVYHNFVLVSYKVNLTGSGILDDIFNVSGTIINFVKNH